MGVLDDAIKQHLELKRRRGADAGEIKREEDEALGGPVRTLRSGSDQAVADHPDEAAPADLAEAEAPDEPVSDSTAHQPTEAFNPAEVAEALGQMPDEAIGEQAEEPEAEAKPEPEQQPVAEPQHEAEPEPDPPEPDEGPSPATEEPVAEEEAAPADEDSDEDAPADDELEETPEFLEDAPEHDKLWFEQKPPKDFDF